MREALDHLCRRYLRTHGTNATFDQADTIFPDRRLDQASTTFVLMNPFISNCLWCPIRPDLLFVTEERSAFLVQRFLYFPPDWGMQLNRFHHIPN